MVDLNRKIARSSDEYDHRAREYAVRLNRTELSKTQIRGLETLAYTTNKVSDVTDWIKKHVAKDAKRNLWAKDGIGRELLITLEGLRQDAKEIVKTAKNYPTTFREDPDLERQLHLRLIREYLKHLVAHFEYQHAVKRQQ